MRFRRRTPRVAYAWVVVTILLPMVARAQVGTPIKLKNPLASNNIAVLIEKLLDAVTVVGTPIAVFFIIYSGFLFITAQGNPTKLQDARQSLLWTMIGTAVLLGAFVLAAIIRSTIDELR